MLEIVELVEAGAGRGEQDDVAGLGQGSGAGHGVGQGLDLFERKAVVELRGDLFAGGADQEHVPGARAQRLAQRAEVAALVLAAQDDDEVTGESINGLEGRVDVGGLGVVVVGDAADLGDEFQPVLDSLEAGHGGADFFRGHSQQPRRAHRRQDVLQVVLAFQADVFAGEHAFAAGGVGEDYPAVFDVAAHVQPPLPAEPEALGADFGGELRGQAVVGVEDGEVVAALVAEEAGLGGHVVAHGGVAVEVVRREVEQRRHPRPETGDGLELEARDLDHVHRVVAGRVHQRDERRADVAADLRASAGFTENLAEQRRGGGLAVRAGHRHHRAAQEAPGELELGDDFDSLPAGLDEGGQLQRDAGAQDDEVGGEEVGLVVAGALHADPESAQGSGVGGDGRFGLELTHGDAGAAGGEEAGRGRARAGQPHHQRLPVFQLHRLLTAASACSRRTARKSARQSRNG